jgi:hypothetical protein
MNRAVFRLDLLDDLVLSESAATAGQHSSLDHIPGGTLLGAVAARLYEILDADTAFHAFHSGRVRFGNGLPIAPLDPGRGGEIAWPAPLSLHVDKGMPTEPARSRDLSLSGAGSGDRQVAQVRDIYTTPSLRAVRPAHVFSMKTAIDPLRGRARDQQLFGYQALVAGQSFVAAIDGDAGAETAWQRVVGDLESVGEVRLGRSRSAEYGRVRIVRLDRTDIVRPPEGRSDDGRLRLWALSDLCLSDPLGQPTLRPTGAHFGFPEAEVDWDRSFLRSRRYAPFNGKWGTHGLERVVIAHGSVIVLTGDGFDDAAARDRLANAGVGAFREAGLGRVAVDPWLLGRETPAPAREVRQVPLAEVEPVSTRESPLLRWLEARHADRSTADERNKAVEHELKELETIYRQASLWLAGTEGVVCGPGVSQWNAVRDAAERAAGDAAWLNHRLFEEGGVARADDPVWRTRYAVDRGDGPPATFHGWLRGLVDRLEKQAQGLERTLPELAKRAATRAKERAAGGDGAANRRAGA